MRMVVPGPLADDIAFARSVSLWIEICTGGGDGGAGGCGGKDGESVGDVGAGDSELADGTEGWSGGGCGAVLIDVG